MARADRRTFCALIFVLARSGPLLDRFSPGFEPPTMGRELGPEVDDWLAAGIGGCF